MPELPEVAVYIEALEQRVLGQTLTGIRIANPFVLRTVDPRPSELAGRRVVGLRRVGKRIAMELEGGLFIVIHLMIAGRFRWLAAGAKVPGKIGLAAFDFESGTLAMTEAGSKRRATWDAWPIRSAATPTRWVSPVRPGRVRARSPAP